MNRQITLSIFLVACLFSVDVCSADLAYTTAEFSNRVVITNNASTYSIQADAVQNGTKVGTLTATLNYGGGTNPFEMGHSWSVGSSMQINGNSTTSAENNETADGFWELSITPEAGYTVRGMTLFSDGTILGNPTIANFTSNGANSLWDGNDGQSNELISNFDDGDSIANGSNIIFNPGTVTTGINIADHSQRWSLDSSGANNMSFTWQAGPVSGVGREGIRFDAAFSAVPEPTSAIIIGLAGVLATLRRRRKSA